LIPACEHNARFNSLHETRGFDPRFFRWGATVQSHGALIPLHLFATARAHLERIDSRVTIHRYNVNRDEEAIVFDAMATRLGADHNRDA
jgi:hypothetical protein